MADPVSIGMMALTAASTIYGAASDASTARANARIDERNAATTEAEGVQQQEALRRRGRATNAEAMAALGMNGTVVGTGSALDLITQNAVDNEYDILNARYQAESKAYGLRVDAANKRKQAKGMLIGGLLRAGSQALTQFGSISAENKVSAASAAARMPTMPGTTMPLPSSTTAGAWSIGL